MSNDDLSMLGLDPSTGMPHYNLAGVDGIPDPSRIAQPVGMEPFIRPDFASPDFAIPGLRMGDLTGPGIDQVPEWQPDPLVGDLMDPNQPYNVDQVSMPEGIQPDPWMSPDVPTAADIAASMYPGLGFNALDVRHGVKDVDPMVADLQHPDLTQEIHMQERPAELDPSALSVMDASKTAQLIKDKDYPEVWMDQRGYNNTRARHFTLLMDGLHDEEKR